MKIIPSPLHNAGVAGFHDFLRDKFIHLGVHDEIFSVGCGLFGDLNGRCKEGDDAFNLARRPGNEFPSLVVEVGVSKSLQMLMNDVGYWLTQSGGQTRIVILLLIDMVSKKIFLQGWECINYERPRHANVYHSVAEKVISKVSKLCSTNKNLGNNAILKGITCMQAKIYKKGCKKIPSTHAKPISF